MMTHQSTTQNKKSLTNFLSSTQQNKSEQPKKLNKGSTFKKLKYHLNRPKILKEFKNTQLFNLSINPKTKNNLLKEYSQRYTFNNFTKSYQKQNLNSFLCDYDIEFSGLDKCQLYDDKKLVKLKKKNMTQLKTYISQIKQNNQIEFKEQQKNKNRTSRKSNKTYKFVDIQPIKKQQNIKDDSNIARKLNGKVYKTSFQSKFLNKSNQNIRLQNHFQRKSLNILTKPIKLKTSFNQFQQFYAKKTQKQILNHYVSAKKPSSAQKLRNINELSYSSKIREQITKSRRQLMNKSKCGLMKSQKSLFCQQDKLKSQKKFFQQQQELQAIKRQQQKRQFFKLLDQEIDKLYNIIQELRLLGYSLQKSNQWIWEYCQNNKKFMQGILFKTEGYRSKLTQCKIIYKLQDINNVKQVVRKFKRTINNQQIYLQPIDFNDLLRYLQEILISKQYFQLKRLQTKIQDTTYQIKNNYLQLKDQKVDDILKVIDQFGQKKKIQPIQYYQMLNFYNDVKLLELRFGKIKGLTNANKRKCQNLTDIELEIMRKKK